ncbi:MAG: class I SAM-dependent methyltransferase [Actinobacteria bacterium]|nr:class I SAM-dependent methyltransferase [Actinomycetota bacterium]
MEGSFELHLQRRGLFSSDVVAYDFGRPGYPDRVYELLQQVCGLGPGTDVLEIGPGTGQATGRLLECGATVTAVELGAEMAAALEAKYQDQNLSVVVGAFEEVALEPESFDLVVAATSFHWIPPDTGLPRCADLLRPGGWLAPWWTHFGDPDRPDPFRDAVTPVFQELAPSLIDTFPGIAFLAGAPLHAAGAEARTNELDASGRFGPVLHEVIPWTGRHTPAELRALFGSYSPCLALPLEDRARVLDAIEELATDTFHGLVERPYLTLVYLAPRRV